MCSDRMPYKQVTEGTRAKHTGVGQTVYAYYFEKCHTRDTRAWVRQCVHTILESSIQGTHGLGVRACTGPCVHTIWCHTGWVHDLGQGRVNMLFCNFKCSGYMGWGHERVPSRVSHMSEHMNVGQIVCSVFSCVNSV